MDLGFLSCTLLELLLLLKLCFAALVENDTFSYDAKFFVAALRLDQGDFLCVDLPCLVPVLAC